MIKACSYTSVAVSADTKTTYAVGSDRSLKEIVDSQVSVLLSYKRSCYAYTSCYSGIYLLVRLLVMLSTKISCLQKLLRLPTGILCSETWVYLESAFI